MVDTILSMQMIVAVLKNLFITILTVYTTFSFEFFCVKVLTWLRKSLSIIFLFIYCVIMTFNFNT